MKAISAELRGLLGVAERLREVGDVTLDGGWGKKEILGHLIDSAVNNLHRLVRMQQQAVLEFPDYDQPGWVRLQHYRERPWTELIELWVILNQHLAHVIEHLDAVALDNRWKAPEGELTLRFVAEDYLVHMRHHLRQLGVVE